MGKVIPFRKPHKIFGHLKRDGNRVVYVQDGKEVSLVDWLKSLPPGGKLRVRFPEEEHTSQGPPPKPFDHPQ